jgi:hypothetical protein
LDFAPKRFEHFSAREYDPDAARWKTFLVPDPKKALDELKSILGKWADILPILRTACAKAEPRVSEGTCSSPQRTPGSKYVENLLTEAFQYLHPEEFLRESIKRA